MSVSNKFKEAVEAKNLSAVRDGLCARIPLDPNLTKGFKESLEYCLSHGISESELYEPHDGRPLSDETSNSNFETLCGQSSTNFSKERVDKIREIGGKLFPPLKEEAETPNGQPMSEKKKEDGIQWIAGLAAGAIAGGLLGGLLFKKAAAGIIGAAVGAIAGAAAEAVFSNKSEN